MFNLLTSKTMQLKTISPKECNRWDLADRALDEFGNIFELANDIRRNGQIEPVLVRPIKGKDFNYEVIAGARRWKACLETNQQLNVIIKPLSDTEAMVAQIRENEKLKLSDYSKGLSYNKMIKSKTTTITELASILKCSKAKLHNFLSFDQIPDKIMQAIGRKDKVSSRSAATILALGKKGTDYVNALINIAEEIRLGAGRSTIEKLVQQELKGELGKNEQKEIVTGKNDEIIATWKPNGIVFAKGLNVDRGKFNKMLAEFFTSNN